MNSFLCIMFSVLLLLSSCESSPSLKKKLQIGVKKRIDNCTLKSKRGDTLFVNYVVGQFKLTVVMNKFQVKFLKVFFIN